MRVFRCLVVAAALVFPVLDARLHGLGSERALVLVENNEAAHAPDDGRALTAEAREAPQGEPSPPEFVPTHEWQDIQRNQPIPPVRVPLILLSGCP